MLDRVRWPTENDYEATPAAWDKLQPQFGAREIFILLKRQWKVIATIVILCLLLSFGVLMLSPVRYSATAQVMIDPTRVEVTPLASAPDRQLDTLAIETQVEVGRSGNVLRQVVQTLKLVDDPEFGASQVGSGFDLGSVLKLKDQLLGLIRSDPEDQIGADAIRDSIQATIEKLRRSLAIRRVGATNVIEIEVLSRNRLKSAEIANTVADEYLADHARARGEAIDKASKWLEERLVGLRVEAQSAEDALQEFKAKNRSGQSSAMLLDLEAQAQSYRKLYETFLDRHIAVDQQISSPTLNARVITRATPPQRKSEPKSLLILGAALGIGAALGLTVGLTRERLSRKLRSADDILSTLELPCLGLIPDIDKVELPSLYNSGSQQIAGGVASNHVKMEHGLAHLTLAVLAETKPLDRRVIAITSLRKGEGVTSIATALAHNLCRLGKTVSFIDAHFRNTDPAQTHPDQTGWMYNPAGNGALASDVGSFSGQHSPTFTPAEVNLDGPGLEKFINTARSDFDYVVIDAPPLEDSLNVLPSLSSSDGVLLLINSAVTRKSQVLSTLKSWSYVNGKILGVILNRAPLNL